MADFIPPDTTRCQAMKLAGSFMTLGPRQWERCQNAPVVIATEVNPGPDGQRGSMSLCEECEEALQRQQGPDYATFVPVNPADAQVKQPSVTP